MVKKYGVNLLALLICSLILLTGWGCTKKITTTDNLISNPGKDSPAHNSLNSSDKKGKDDQILVAELVYDQEPSLSDESGRITGNKSDSNTLVLNLGDIFFDFDKDVIRQDSLLILDKNVKLLKENNDLQIIIEGHTDERGTNEYNLTLGERRSHATKRYLVARGIEPERIRTITYGEEKSFCNEQTEECFQLNRRGHFVPSDKQN